MLMKRIKIKFNEYVFDNFYVNNPNAWPPVEIYLVNSEKGVYRVRKSTSGYNVYNFGEANSYRTVSEEELYMYIPEYLSELIPDLEVLPSIESHYSV